MIGFSDELRVKEIKQMTDLEIFLQGGLGNQLIQGAYCFNHLCGHSDRRVIVNPILLRRPVSLLRRVTHRRLHPFYTSEQFKQLQNATCVLRSSFRSLIHGLMSPCFINDQKSDGMVENQLTDIGRDRCVAVMGYFHRASAFSHQTNVFWESVAAWLKARHTLSVKEPSRVAAHIRLGDYTTQSNRKVYAALPIGTQISTAMRWRDELGGDAKVDLITDDPRQLETLIPSAIKSQCRVLDNQGENLDFATLCSYQSIVTSNSTYSLVAANLASVLWGKALTAQLPDSWYQQKQRNQAQILEWRQLSFVSDFWSGTD